MSDDKRISVGTQLRGAIKDQLDHEVERLGNGMGIRQTIIEAALLTYFANPEEDRTLSVERVLASNMMGGARSLVQDAQIKAERAAKPHPKPAKSPRGKRA
ncbi:MAG: hypothetical protein AAGI37_06810 [Planctomycetota bacterium]